VASLFRRRQTPPRPDEIRTADLSAFGVGVPSPLSDYESGSVSVGAEQAVESVIAVYACVSLLADLAGSLPLHLFSKTTTGRERVEVGTGNRALRGRGYPGSLARLIGANPNPEMTAQELWTTAVGHCALWGNSYIEVIRSEDGRPSELWPLRPDRMKVDRKGGDLIYSYQVRASDPTRVEIPEVMHLRLFGTDGVMGISPITVARKTINADRGAQAFTARWYTQGAQPSSIVTIPKGPGEKFKDRTKVYREALQSLYGGASNAGKIAVLEEGISWQSVSMAMKDMQFIETRKFTVAEIARLYRIPPHLIQDVERDSSWGTGIENQNLSFLAYTLRPILSRIEGGITRDLGLVPGVKTLADEGLYPEFITADLLRADISTRYTAYATGVQWGILTRADARQFENLPYIPGLEAPLTPTNMVAGDPPTVENQKPEPAPEPVTVEPEDDALRMALIANLSREPQQQVIEFPPPAPVSIFNKDVTSEVQEAVRSITPPSITVDTNAIAKVIAQAEARRILDAEKRDEREAERHAEVMAALKPAPPVALRRRIERDPETNLITTVIDEPEEAAV
jgi:HK97 family phage portal protein